MKTKKNNTTSTSMYSKINDFSTLLTISEEKLENIMSKVDPNQRWDTFKNIFIQDVQILIDNFEYLENKKNIKILAKKHYNDIVKKIKNAKINNIDHLTGITIPCSEINTESVKKLENKNIKLDKKLLENFFCDHNKMNKEYKLYGMLMNQPPNLTIGMWKEVIKKLLQKKYTVIVSFVDYGFVIGITGTLTIKDF